MNASLDAFHDGLALLLRFQLDLLQIDFSILPFHLGFALQLGLQLLPLVLMPKLGLLLSGF